MESIRCIPKIPFWWKTETKCYYRGVYNEEIIYEKWGRKIKNSWMNNCFLVINFFTLIHFRYFAQFFQSIKTLRATYEVKIRNKKLKLWDRFRPFLYTRNIKRGEGMLYNVHVFTLTKSHRFYILVEYWIVSEILMVS